MNYAVIGAGISGLAAAAMLREEGQDVTVFEKEERPGGLIRCERVEGCLFHRTGGHVFNTKRDDVLEWFWRHFDREAEFTKASRNSTIAFENASGGTFCVPYPIEDHVYLLDEATQRGFIADLLSPSEEAGEGFEGFLKQRFGATLYELYFGPYNRKVWRRDLRHVPLEWLEGKLPMPTKEQMIFNNMNRVEERAFVHSTFWYPKTGGSQFIVDRLARGTTVVLGEAVKRIERDAAGKLCVNGRAGLTTSFTQVMSNPSPPWFGGCATCQPLPMKLPPLKATAPRVFSVSLIKRRTAGFTCPHHRTRRTASSARGTSPRQTTQAT